MYDLIIIGTGPAGLCAAIYAQRARLHTLLLEKSFANGGQIINTSEVDNYPGLPGVTGLELAEAMKAHAEKTGIRPVRENVKEIRSEGSIKKVITNKSVYETKTVLIAAGARHSLLGVPGEEELAGAGVSYCATCDGAFYKDQTVAVVGGGNVAVEDAILLARICKKVYVIHRRDELRAERILQENLLAMENVEMCWNSVVVSIDGEEEVTGVTIENKTDGSVTSLEVNGVFIAVGIQPNTESFTGLVEQDDKGYLVAGEDGKTSVEGIFAAGDVRTKEMRQIITAASDGANAVHSIQKYLLTLPV
ncbi:MAG: thioredoxin-disulfide reductase [Blautia sp.]|jgi:thioredoxin reductase (NADPH)